MGLRYITVFAAICGLAIGRITKIEPCALSQASVCEVTEARIEPCPGAEDKIDKVCRLTKGRDASISFEIIPHFVAQNMTTGAFYNGIPFEGLGSTNACEFTKCPTESGVKQTMNYALTLGKKLPSGLYQFEWKVWNNDNPDELCCFKPTIKLAKR